jgi:hypothetical protein
MPEKGLISLHCERCKKTSYPFGFQEVDLPFLDTVLCRYCGFKMQGYVLDSKLSVEKIRKDLGLDQSQVNPIIDLLKNEIETLKSTKNADRKEIDALSAIVEAARKEVSTLRELIDLVIRKQLEEVKNNDSERAKEIDSILERLHNVEEEIKFQKDNK